jgi:putative endonuclease
MNSKSNLGREGEDFACKYLVDKGFKLIEKNFRRPWGEIDIIAIAPDKTLVFVEVKTIKNYFGQGLKPEDQLTLAKLKKLQKTASLYANEKPDLVNAGRGWRIDLIALTKIGNDYLVKHYENI